MILAIDVGNTHIMIGVLDGDRLVCTGRMSTGIYETDEEYAIKFGSFLDLHNVKSIDGAIISSVVPALVRTLRKAVYLIIGVQPLIVGPGIKTGLDIKMDNPAEIGADLIAGAVASTYKYPCPQIVFDFGTATTITVIDKNKSYIGGAILCGVKTAINAISAGTAQLPQIDISAPSKAIATGTVDCMKSGAVLGTAAMLDGMVQRYEEELSEKATVIVTGGLGNTIARNCKTQTIVDENLLIDGLKIIYDKNTQ